MRLLVLGGTGFVGGATVTEAVRRGWSVTVFNRGLHGDVPAGVHRLRGDRTAPGGLAALAGGEWDLVVDTWDGAPRAVRDAARALVGAARHYVYVSSGSVYAEPVEPGSDEDAPTVEATADAVDGGYAQLKAGGERAAVEVFGDRALLARAGLILGPGEDIGRLPWWLGRVARGGEVLAPGPRELPLQYVDVRDLAAWLLDRGAEGIGGAYNVVGRSGHTTMGELLDAAVAATGAGALLRWTDPEPILAAGVEPWNDLPIWIPLGHEYRWLQERDVERAYAAGLVCRPVAETVVDTWRWLREVGRVPPRAGRPARVAVGLDPEREAALLATVAGRGTPA
ncbi:NAD-dependent epimerase/dehydratase family protein [Micromonospora sp. RTP1Z1]|uniref:NAD-dependent epimerase/dehydratase family protein n=1 Tax=Micromonospora sp. RTP1Z1 TaxID=2994043 RepID=UPI0029C64E87|nr:NAD-dependent epimerase/dehydratase family protein [Micromonospora sp. RTP1Z1]